jgi:hypothetical protein
MSYGRRDEGDKDEVYFLTKEDVYNAAQSQDNNDQSAAYNAETGEINWDCPCLGGMAKGPCGEEFKTAFSCFVFSEAEHKGSDCISQFQAMQKCFQTYPEYYADQLREDEEEDLQQQQAVENKEAEAEQSVSSNGMVAVEQSDANTSSSGVVQTESV